MKCGAGIKNTWRRKGAPRGNISRELILWERVREGVKRCQRCKTAGRLSFFRRACVGDGAERRGGAGVRRVEGVRGSCLIR